jgi:hypothetical protein
MINPFTPEGAEIFRAKAAHPDYGNPMQRLYSLADSYVALGKERGRFFSNREFWESGALEVSTDAEFVAIAAFTALKTAYEQMTGGQAWPDDFGQFAVQAAIGTAHYVVAAGEMHR